MFANLRRLHFAAQAVKVNSLGKWKTALQMVAMSGMLLLHRVENVLGSDHELLEHLQWATYACLLLLWAGAFLSVGPVAFGHPACYSDHGMSHMLCMPLYNGTFSAHATGRA